MEVKLLVLCDAKNCPGDMSRGFVNFIAVLGYKFITADPAFD